jgi:hypothetical protein
VKRIWVITAVLFPLGVLADIARGASQPGLTAVLGFAGCALIVYVSKGLGKAALARPEAYYAHPDVEEGLGDDA